MNIQTISQPIILAETSAQELLKIGKSPQAEKLVSIPLSDFIPFTESNIEKFSICMQFKKFQQSLKKEKFYEKNEEGTIFIEQLTQLGTPQSLEELHVRNYLLGMFFPFLPIYKENGTEVKSLDKMYYTSDYINDICQKSFLDLKNQFSHHNPTKDVPSIEELEQKLLIYYANYQPHSKNPTEIKDTPQTIYNEFFSIFPKHYTLNLPGNNTEVYAAFALVFKLMKYMQEDANLPSNNMKINIRRAAAHDYADSIMNINDYWDNSFRNFFIQTFTGNFNAIFKYFLLNNHNAEKDLRERTMIETIGHTALTDIIISNMEINKVHTRYETLNASVTSKSNEKAEDFPKVRKNKI